MRILNKIKKINILLKRFKSMFRIIPSKIVEFKEYYVNKNKILEKISYNNSEYFFDTSIEDLDKLIINLKKLKTIKEVSYKLVDQSHFGKDWLNQFLIKDQKKEIKDYIEQEHFEKIVEGEIYSDEKYFTNTYQTTPKSSEILASVKISKEFEEKYVLLIKGPFLIKDEDANLIKKVSI